MPFYLYRVVGQDIEKVRQVRMGGKNTIYNGWIMQNRPLNRGWHMDKNEIISQTEKGGTYDSHRIVIDLVPKSTDQVILLELLDVYGFTYADPDWTPLMFRMRDVFSYQEKSMCAAKIASLKKRFQPMDNERDIFEFVYLQGNWNPGRVGGWNAPLLHHKALNYFKGFF
jgi:hypothetical protein